MGRVGGLKGGFQDLFGGGGGEPCIWSCMASRMLGALSSAFWSRVFFGIFRPREGEREGGEAAQFWLRQRFFADVCSVLVELSCTDGVKMVQYKALVETSRIKLSCTGGKMCTRVALDVWSTGEPFVQIWCTAYKCKTGGVEFCVTSSAFCT